MTNEELFAQIRKKIERLYGDNPFSEDRWNLGYDRACEDMMEFLIALEEQTKYKVSNPIFDECVSGVDPEVMEEVSRNIDIENELVKYFGKLKDYTLGMHIARHFAQWGAEHLKK